MGYWPKVKCNTTSLIENNLYNEYGSKGMKEVMLDFIKIKNFLSANDSIKKMRIWDTELAENILPKKHIW